MTGNTVNIRALALLVAVLAAIPAWSRAADTGTNPPASSSPPAYARPKKHDHPPFHGKLSAVDTNAMTLTVGALTLQVTSDTRITRDGRPAALWDGVVGKPVSGTYRKTADGKLNAVTVHFGVKSVERLKKKIPSKTGI